MGPAFLVDSCLACKREVRWESIEKKKKKKTQKANRSLSEKIRRHRNPFRNHSRFLEEDIRKKKPQPQVLRELKENPTKA